MSNNYAFEIALGIVLAPFLLPLGFAALLVLALRALGGRRAPRRSADVARERLGLT